MWHAIHLDREFATLRQGDHGVTDTEWELGCRVIRMSYKNESDAKEYIVRVGIAVLDTEAWNAMIREINGDDVPSNKFISTYKPYDKWEQLPIIY